MRTSGYYFQFDISKYPGCNTKGNISLSSAMTLQKKDLLRNEYGSISFYIDIFNLYNKFLLLKAMLLYIEFRSYFKTGKDNFFVS